MMNLPSLISKLLRDKCEGKMHEGVKYCWRADPFCFWGTYTQKKEYNKMTVKIDDHYYFKCYKKEKTRSI